MTEEKYIKVVLYKVEGKSKEKIGKPQMLSKTYVKRFNDQKNGEVYEEVSSAPKKKAPKKKAPKKAA